MHGNSILHPSFHQVLDPCLNIPEVELKLARPTAYPLTQTLRVAYKHNQVCLFHPKAIENIRNSYLLIPLS